MTRKLFVTTALPYANGPFQLGHIMEYIQPTSGSASSGCAEMSCISSVQTTRTARPSMPQGRGRGYLAPELVARVTADRPRYLQGFHIGFDHWYSTDSPENVALSQDIYRRLKAAGLIYVKAVEQFYDPVKAMFLADRYIKGDAQLPRQRPVRPTPVKSAASSIRPPT